MSLSNFQDVIVLSSDTLNAGIERFVIGSSAGSKSVVFAQDLALASAMHLAASNPTAARTAILPDANGTIGYLTNISAGTTAVTNGQIVFSNSNEFVFGINASTLTAGLTTISMLQLGAYNNTGTGVSYRGQGTNSSSGTATTMTITGSDAQASGIRMAAIYPMRVTYIDPKGQGFFELSALMGVSVLGSASASFSWWCGIYTISASTAGMLSSASSSTSLSTNWGNTSGTASVTFDRRFTNITWNVTPGDYMFFTGHVISVSGSVLYGAAGNITGTIFAHVSQTMPGAQVPEASYSVGYWTNGSISQSATSFHLTNLSNSAGNTTEAPYVRLIGS